MEQHYLLWASGEDRPGLVAAVTKALFDHGMNLEDSSMMRLGAEFGIFLIFSSKVMVPLERLERDLAPIGRRLRLALGVKKISRRQATARRSAARLHIVSVHGPDRPGIVYRVTQALARRKFNITDLTTYRTTSGGRAGYVLLIEGEIPSAGALAAIRADLLRIRSELKTTVDIRAVTAEPL